MFSFTFPRNINYIWTPRSLTQLLTQSHCNRSLLLFTGFMDHTLLSPCFILALCMYPSLIPLQKTGHHNIAQSWYVFLILANKDWATFLASSARTSWKCSDPGNILILSLSLSLIPEAWELLHNRLYLIKYTILDQNLPWPGWWRV